MGGKDGSPYLDKIRVLTNLLDGLMRQVLWLWVVNLVCELLEMLRGALLHPNRVAEELLATVGLLVLSSACRSTTVDDIGYCSCVLALTHALVVRTARCKRGERVTLMGRSCGCRSDPLVKVLAWHTPLGVEGLLRCVVSVRRVFGFWLDRLGSGFGLMGGVVLVGPLALRRFLLLLLDLHSFYSKQIPNL